MDVATANYVKEHGLPIPPLTYELLDTIAPECHNAKSIEKLLVHRNYLLRNISQAGLGFASLSVNTILLEPLRFAAIRNKEIFGQRLSVNSTEISDGVWGITTAFSRSGLRLLKNVISCQERSLSNIPDEHDVAEISLRSNPHCIRNIATACLNSEVQKNYAESLTILPESFVASGHSVFALHLPQKRGIYPSIMHQDLLCDSEEGLLLLKQWNFVLKEEQFHRMMPHGQIGSALVHSHNTKGRAGLVIRILTMNRQDQLATLLSSLKAADYEQDRVDMEIHIDYPSDPTSHALRLYATVQEAAKNFEWTHGELKIVDPGTPRGLFNMWVQPFEPKVEGQVLMVLEDDNEVSPVFYQWFKSLLIHLSDSDDPRLFGFSLQRQHSVIGLRSDQKYTTNFIDLRMDPSRLFYRYQLLSSSGSVLFPGHWNAFVKWINDVRSSSPDFQPCVPFFFNNIWYLKKSSQIWSIWFNYYVYMHGLYSMYINYSRYDMDGRYFSLLKNHPANGLHFKSKPKPSRRKPDMQDMLELLIEPAPKMFLPPTAYPLFDFHLQSVSKEDVLSDRWRFMSNIHDKCQVNHPNMLRQ